MDQLRLAVVALLLATGNPSPVVTTADDPPLKPAPEPAPKPLVAAVWVKLGACGAREVVIEPSADRLKARGLTVQQLTKAVQGRRFVSGEWLVVIDDKQYDLTRLAKLTVRDLQSPPFTVKLRDGRSVLITPDPEQIGRYVVTGEYFEQVVRRRLADFAGAEPGKIRVLQMIPVPGTVIPHLTAEDMTHVSIGEPLETFGKVEVRGKPKAAATDSRWQPAWHWSTPCNCGRYLVSDGCGRSWGSWGSGCSSKRT